SLQDAITVDAAGVNGERPSHLLYTTALVDVAMNRKEGLVANDCVAYGRRSNRFHDRAAMDWAKGRVERGRLVKPGPVRGSVEIESGALHVGDPAGHCLDLRRQFLLRRLAEGVPGRRVRPAHRDQVEAIEVEHLALGEGHARRRLEYRVDLEEVVVTAVQDAGHLAALELAVGHVKPAVEG